MAASGSARRLPLWLFGMVAVAVVLAGAPIAHAADSTPAGGSGSAPIQAVTGQTDADQHATQPAAQQAVAPGGSDAGVVGEAAGPSGASGAGGPSSAGDHPAANTNQGAAENAQGAGDNAASTPATAGAQGTEPESDGPPPSGAEQETSVAQTAAATAAATQGGVGNTAVTVQLDQPGEEAPLTQANQAQGNAQASVNAESATPATTDQAAGAEATGTQSDVQNTAVTVRVGSPGGNGAVHQSNTATAHAATSVTSPANGHVTTEESAVAAAAQDGASNTNVSIRVFSPGSDGPVGQSNNAAAAAETSGPHGASATATQTGARNTNVSVRVESDGTTGAVSQTSASTASASGEGDATATTEGGLDTDLSVVVDGDSLVAPGAGGLQIWEWTWTWDRDESVDAPLDTQPSSWNWAWGSTGAPAGAQPTQVTPVPGSAQYTAGSWTWNWDWTRGGAPDWAWDWTFAGQLPCGSCVWIWNWTWNWTGQPVQTGSTAAARESSNHPGTPPDQANLAIAGAEASVTADVAQTISQDGVGEGAQYAGQVVSVDQSADVVATATQSDMGTLATADQFVPQLNLVVSHAAAAVGADLKQQVDQAMLVGAEGDAAQLSGQEIDVVQVARASVRAGQSGITLRTGGTSRSEGVAVATTLADVNQRVAQEALVVGGTTDQWAGQLTLVDQSGDALSVVDQAAAPVPHFVGGIARARSISGAVAQVDQELVQSAARGGGLGSQAGMQAVYVGQDGSAIASTTQQTGSTAGPATSEARATNQALVVQNGLQQSTGALALDIQDLSQQSIVVQTAIAVSTSAGGIAGVAVVFNCAAVQQLAGQSLAGGTGNPMSRDISTFCAPPAAVPGAATPVAGTESAVFPVFATPSVEVSASSLPTDDLDVMVFRDHRRLSAAADGMRATTPRVRLVRPEQASGRLVPESPAMTQISAPRPTQARLDTRPGDHAGAGDAGREPPLSPAGGPPSWVSAFAPAAASGAGPSGIAAILADFALVPPLLLRAREGSVVRRPIDVLSRVDVPV